MKHATPCRLIACWNIVIITTIIGACAKHDMPADTHDNDTQSVNNIANHGTALSAPAHRPLNETLSANLKRVGNKVDTLQRQGIATNLKITITQEDGCTKPVSESIAYAGCFDGHGLALVIGHKGQDAKAGFINYDGELIIPMVYDVIMSNGELNMGIHDGLIALRKNGKWGYMDTHGKTVIDFIYADARPFSDGYAAVLPLPPDQLPNPKLRASHLWGYIDKKGQALTEFKYAYAHAFSENLAQVISEQDGHSVREFIDNTGKVIITHNMTKDYTDIAPTFHRGVVAVVAKNSLGYMDKTGKLAIPLLYQVPDKPAVLPAFNDSMVTVKTKKGLTLCINIKNQQVACE